MAKSYPYNIFITRDPTVLDTVFFDTHGRTTFSERFSSLTAKQKRDSIHISPMTNDNFIGIDISFPTGGGAMKYVVLKLVETSKLLEYFSVSKSGLEEIIKKRVRQRKSFIGNEALFDELRQGINPRFYLSYGVGDDLSQWSGPYSMTLVDANLSVTSDNIRKVELMFMPNPETLAVFSNKIFSDAQYAQKDSIFDSSKILTLTNLTEGRYQANSFDEEKYIEGSKLYGGPNKGWNFCVRDIVHKFLSERFPSLPKGNVAILMDDDFDKPHGLIKPWQPHAPRPKVSAKITVPEVLVEDTISQIAHVSRLDRLADIGGLESSITARLRMLGISMSFELEPTNPYAEPPPPRIQRPWDSPQRTASIAADVAKVLNAKKIRQKNNLIDQLEGEINHQVNELNVTDPRDLQWVERMQASVQRLEGEIMAIREHHQGEQEEFAKIASGGGYYRESTTEAPPGLSESAIKSKRQTNNVDLKAESENLKYKEITLSMGGQFYTDQVNEKGPLEILKSLQYFVSYINAFTTDDVNDFTILEENDYRILKLLKDMDLIDDPTQSVVLFGRKRIIEGLLYPKRYQNSSPKSSNSSNKGRLFAFFAGDRGAALGDDRWDTYRKSFKDIFFKGSGPRTSSFNESIDFGAFKNYLKPPTKSDDLVIFMHNMKNSNVLDVSFDSSPYKGELMSMATKSSYALIDASIDGQYLMNDVIEDSSVGSLVNMIAERVKQSYKGESVLKIMDSLLLTDASSIVIDLLSEEEGSPLKALNMKTFLELVLFKAFGDQQSLTQIAPPGKRAGAEVNILSKLNKYIINVNIKTLPFFNIPCFPGQQSFLYGMPNYIIGANNLSNKFNSTPSLFTGNFMITGYKHTMTSEDAYSEFSLIRTDGSASVVNLSVAKYFDKVIKRIKENRKKEKK